MVTPPYEAGLVTCAVAVLVVVAVVLVRRRFVMVTVRGLSMLPTLKAGDRVLVRRTQVGRLRRGQLAVAAENGRSADASREWVIKRVAAVPGDPRPACLPDTSDPADRVPDGHYVLLGDNAAVSYDSRQRGYFTSGQLLGVVVRGYAQQATSPHAPGPSLAGRGILGAPDSQPAGDTAAHVDVAVRQGSPTSARSTATGY